MNKNLTIKEFSEITGMEYQWASAIVALLVDVGQAKAVGKKPADGGRGKPSVIYEIAPIAEFQFWNPETGEENTPDVESAEIPTPQEIVKDLVPA